MKSVDAWVLKLCLVLTVALSAQPDAMIEVDATAAGVPLKPVWNYYGYDECNFTTSQGGRDLLQAVVEHNRTPVYIRSHFLLNTGDGTEALKWGSTNTYTEDDNGNPVYDWIILDDIMDDVTGAGAIPLTEIGFMPQALSSRPDPYRNSHTYALDGGCFYPPRDYDRWAGLIREWAGHSMERYPGMDTVWLWELWNEPNIGYWHGRFDEYCRLYDYTEYGLHEAAPRAVLGGPHVAGPDVNFLRGFLEHCSSGRNAVSGQTGTRLDYVGFHAKGGVTMVDGHVRMDLGNQLRLHRNGFNTVHDFPEYRNTPVIIGEADPDGCAACPASETPANAYRNVPAYGAYVAAMMKHSLDLARDVGVNLRGLVTWAWMFNDQPYFQGFRTLSTNGIHKPVLNVFKMLGRMTGDRIPLSSSGALGLQAIMDRGVRGGRPDIDGLAVKNDSAVQVIIWNYHDDIVDVPGDSVHLRVTLPDDFPPWVKVNHYRVDDDYSNAYTVWVDMGSPQNPSSEQRERLTEAMQLQAFVSQARMDVADTGIAFGFSLGRHGVSLVEFVRPVLGCMDPLFREYDETAEWDDGGQCRTAGVYLPATAADFQVMRDRFSIRYPGTYSLQIYHVSGKPVFKSAGVGPEQILLEKLTQPGIYLYRIEFPHETFQGRFQTGLL